MALLEIFCGIIAVFAILYYYLTAKFNFWKIRNIAGPKPALLYGNILTVLSGKHHVCEFLNDILNAYPNEPVIGLFERRSPLLIIRDPDLLKDVLVKDFDSFATRGRRIFEKADPLSANLLNLELKRWKPIRKSLTPVFTSSKLKEMFKMIIECSERLEQYLENLVAKDKPVDCRDLSARFTIDVIGRCVFGLEVNAITDENSEFRKMGRQIFSLDFYRMLRIQIRVWLPWFYDMFGSLIGETEDSIFFTKSIKETMAYRKKNNIVINDFINVLMELKENPEKLGDIELTDSLLIAQAFIFFAAGFETSSTTISNLLYELALNQLVQDKLRREIVEEYEKNNGDLGYEVINNMKYLDKVFQETLRMYPPFTYLLRLSCNSYTFRKINVTIPANQRVWIPVYAIHHDPQIYPDPYRFDPERFNDENVAHRHPMNYIPFGEGPKNCIGARFAVYQTKVGVIKILRKHKVQVCEKTQIPYIINPRAFILTPKRGIHLKITKIEAD